MSFHKEGFKIVPIVFFVLLILNVLVYVFLTNNLIAYLFIFASVVFLFFVAWFFRIPNRKISKSENVVLAPADGKIVAIEEVFEKEYFNETRIQISIFMSPLNVHQNLAPVAGEVIYRKHKKGHFYPAFVPKSSEENERCTTVFKMKNGVEILSRQIAGAVARRIANYAKLGDIYAQADEYGFIRFGSRLDVFIPIDTKVCVNIDDKSLGGITVLAKFED
jgi:phosphatidylserine decarboxylase